MAYPYKKIDETDVAFIRSVTDAKRVWVGDAIPTEYYHDEMPEYGIFAPDVYVEVESAQEVSEIMKYCNANNLPITARGAGTGLAGGATCKFGGILLSVMKMNRIIEVDEENLSPTYKYKYSLPGKSYGIEVASRYGIKECVINDAKEELKKENNESSILINELVKKTEQCEKLIKENELMKQKLIKEKLELENNQRLLAGQRSHLLEDVKKEKERLLEDLKRQIDEIKKEVTNKDLKLHEINKVSLKVEDLKDEVEFESFNDEISLGDYVLLPSMGIYGKVNGIKGNNIVLNSDDGITYTVSKNRVKKVEEIKTKKVTNKNSSYIDKIDTSLKLELNIIGLHRDEAEEALIKYLDSCKIKHFKTVRIIHGFGNGILRKMVHEYLNKQKNLSYRLGDINEGGGGATVVTFND